MRKIEENMVNAILAKRSWKGANTEVVVKDSTLTFKGEPVIHILVHLFGNRICNVQYGLGLLTINHCGYHTQTTQSRLNAILGSFGLPLIKRVHDKFVIKGHEWSDGEITFKI